MNKTCRVCGSVKSESEFSKRADSTDGLRSECRACKKATDAAAWNKYKHKKLPQNKEYKLNNKDAIQLKMRKYRENNRESIILGAIRKRANAIGVLFNLTIEDIVIPKYCPLLGIELCFNGGMSNRDTSPSADRIEPGNGYTKGNVKIISYRANRIKNNATPEELKLMASRIDEYSAKQVKSITFESRKAEKGQDEKTIIEIEAVD